MSRQPPRLKIGSPEEWRRGSFAEVKHGVIDVALGGSLFGLVNGAFFGAQYGMLKDLGVAVIMGIVGSFAGAIGGGLISAVVGAVGELICGKLGLDKRVRAKLGGRLDQLRGRLLYGGLVGALGGSVIMVLVLGIYEGLGGTLDRLLTGAIFWGAWGTIGGAVDWTFGWGLQTDRRIGRAVIGGGMGTLPGIIWAAIIIAANGAVVMAVIGALVLVMLGVSIGAITKLPKGTI